MAPRTAKTSVEKPAKSPAAKPRAKPVAAAEVSAEPAASGDAKPKAQVSMLKLKGLVDAVAESTGGKKPEVKAAVEATLAAIGTALATGKSLAVPPLGKLRVVKTRGSALTLKLRLADGPKAAGLGLAEDGEDS